MQSNYPVYTEDFAERHFIKKFSKKYKKHWDTTLTAITAQLSRIDVLIDLGRADIITETSLFKIIKTQFRVDGTQESTKSSGCRCIIAWHTEEKFVSILLVYGKTDLSGKNETAEWVSLIKDNYPLYKKCL
jgi:hypothetical protein